MNKFLRIILYITIITWVGFITYNTRKAYILSNSKTDADIMVYLQDIKNKGFKVDYSIHFKDDKPTILGWCRSFFGFQYITINPSHWNIMYPLRRIELLLHEIGHCTYGLDHDDEKFQDGCYKSLMSSYQNSDYCFYKHEYDYYLTEFKQKINKVKK